MCAFIVGFTNEPRMLAVFDFFFPLDQGQVCPHHDYSRLNSSVVFIVPITSVRNTDVPRVLTLIQRLFSRENTYGCEQTAPGLGLNVEMNLVAGPIVYSHTHTHTHVFARLKEALEKR